MAIRRASSRVELPIADRLTSKSKEGGRVYLPICEDRREQLVWHASRLDVQPIMQAVFDVALKVEVKVPLPADTVAGAAGMKQPVWQFAACELHDIMQFVTVEVTGVESP